MKPEVCKKLTIIRFNLNPSLYESNPEKKGLLEQIPARSCWVNNTGDHNSIYTVRIDIVLLWIRGYLRGL